LAMLYSQEFGALSQQVRQAIGVRSQEFFPDADFQRAPLSQK
jgi:hypothetical protein